MKVWIKKEDLLELKQLRKKTFLAKCKKMMNEDSKND
jgi:hypothetical protein